MKPYLSYVDCRPEAVGGFSEQKKTYHLEVEIAEKWLAYIPKDKKESLIQVLSQDPRPPYQNDPKRIYGMEYAGMDVRFVVADGTLHVHEIIRLEDMD